LTFVDVESGATCDARVPINAVGAAWGEEIGAWVGGTPYLVCRVPVHHASPAIASATRRARLLDTAGLDECDTVRHDEVMRVRRYCDSRLVLVDSRNGDVYELAKPGLYGRVSASRCGEYLLVESLNDEQDFRRRAVSWKRTTEIWRLGPALEVSVAAVLDPPRRSTAERREFGIPGFWYWHPRQAATVVCLDLVERSKWAVLARSAPFQQPATVLLRTDRPVVRFFCTDAGDTGLLDCDTVSRQARLLVGTREGRVTVVHDERVPPGLNLFERSWSLEVEPLPGEVRPIWVDDLGCAKCEGDWLYLTTTVCDADAAVPSVWRISLSTGQTETVFRSAHTRYDRPLLFLSRDDSELLLACEEPDRSAGLAIERRGDRRRYLGIDQDATPTAPIDRIVLEVRPRLESQSLTPPRPGLRATQFDVYLPPEAKRNVPFLVWITAWLPGASVRTRTFPNQKLWLLDFPLWLLDEGLGVAYLPPIHLVPPVLNAPGTLVEQLIASGAAVVDSLVQSGVADRDRIAIGGYCAGAYIAATLLAWTDLFCAGLALSGGYNEAAYPMGAWSTAGRRLWDDPALFMAQSPLARARSVRAPLLLVHGERDRLIPCAASEDMYVAVRETGGTARYVCLPHENHRYICEESIDIVRGEMLRWCRRHVSLASA
jgi:dipeptidyl aminopeptidase/acylaminoacyl peptidase